MKSCARLFLAFLAAGLIAADKPVTDHSKLKTKEAKANAANWPDNSKGSPTPHAKQEKHHRLHAAKLVGRYRCVKDGSLTHRWLRSKGDRRPEC